MAEENKETQQPPIIFNNQYIKDLSLEIPHAPQIFKEIKEQPKLALDINIQSKPLEDSVYNVLLNISLNADVKDKKLFILELSYGAVVTLNMPKEHTEPVLGIEIPRLMFPFARNVVSQCLNEGGLPPILLNPIDFAALYAARQSKGQN